MRTIIANCIAYLVEVVFIMLTLFVWWNLVGFNDLFHTAKLTFDQTLALGVLASAVMSCRMPRAKDLD